MTSDRSPNVESESATTMRQQWYWSRADNIIIL